MTIIVTGDAGFIVSNFVYYMLSHHEDIRLINLDKLTNVGACHGYGSVSKI